MPFKTGLNAIYFWFVFSSMKIENGELCESPYSVQGMKSILFAPLVRQ